MSIFNKVIEKHLDDAQKVKEAREIADSQKEKEQIAFVEDYEQAIEVDVDHILQGFVNDANAKGYPATFQKFSPKSLTQTTVLKISFIPQIGHVIDESRGEEYFLKIKGLPTSKQVEFSFQLDPYKGQDGIQTEKYGIPSLVPQRLHERLESWLDAVLTNWRKRHNSL